jgi:flagellar basal body-associated protein FliL
MRKRLIILLILPIALLLWMIGWTMSWTGSKKEHLTQKAQKETPEDHSITIMNVIPEEIEQQEA